MAKENAQNKDGKLTALPLGGLGEIGMNLMVYECNGEMVIVDVGITFADEYAPGVDVIVPDIHYVRENIDRLKAIVITHAHEDHIGAMPYLWDDMPVPCYVAPFARRVLENKMEGMGASLKDYDIRDVEIGKEIQICDNFSVEYINVTHSIPEANALAIKTPYGTLLHTGDYKLDQKPVLGQKTDEHRLKEIGDEGVLALLGDSTNIFNAGRTGSEGDLAESLDSTIAGCKNRIFFATFGSNLGRVVTATRLAVKHGRKVCYLGRAIRNMAQYGKETGMFPKELEDHIIEPNEVAGLAKNKVMVLVTGTQGERNASLMRLAGGDPFRGVEIAPDDTVILSSQMIPGNERGIFDMMNRLLKTGAKIIHKHDEFVHVSGHPSQDEIAEMLKLVRPEILVPVHGEFQHLVAHAEFGKKCGIKKQKVIVNGQKLQLAPGEPKVLKEDIRSGRNYVDGYNLLDDDQFILKERRQMSFEGVAFISLAIDSDTGAIAGKPRLRTKGLIDEDLQPELLEEAVKEVQKTLKNKFSDGMIHDKKFAEEMMRQAVRRVCGRDRGRKPVTIPLIIEV